MIKTADYNWEYKVINEEKSLEAILTDGLAIHFEFDNENYHKAKLWGIGLSNGKNNYFVNPELLKTEIFKNYLINTKLNKDTYNLKALKVFLLWNELDILNVSYDMLLAAYLVDSHYGKEEFKYLLANFNYDDVEYDDLVYGKGAKKGLPEDVLVYQKHIASKARAIHLTKKIILEEVKEREQEALLNDVELPLSNVLAHMEFEGLLVSKDELNNQIELMRERIKSITDEIISHAGREFNIASPKQVGEVLFEDLALPHGKKNKTGYSTNAEILAKVEKLHPIVPLIIEFRELNKLFTTYLQGFEKEVFEDNKVHTIYQQALTTTGRLSSINPNLQNIPIRTEEGRQIRKFFIAKEDHYLLGADYSQIELRVLADIANVDGLIEAFNNDRDIHSETARLVFDIDEVDDLSRRRAKAVNFGIIYGMGAWSLADDLEVDVKSAEDFINKYFEVYPEIKTYMDEITESATEKGYVLTKDLRRRYIPELKSKVYMQREFGKRIALNAPIQGTAADIIKIAMIKLFEYLEDNNLKSKLILQVHDELILEVPKEELALMEEMVPKIMNSAYKLKVALKTDYDVGKTWYELS